MSLKRKCMEAGESKQDLVKKLLASNDAEAEIKGMILNMCKMPSSTAQLLFSIKTADGTILMRRITLHLGMDIKTNQPVATRPYTVEDIVAGADYTGMFVRQGDVTLQQGQEDVPAGFDLFTESVSDTEVIEYGRKTFHISPVISRGSPDKDIKCSESILVNWQDGKRYSAVVSELSKLALDKYAADYREADKRRTYFVPVIRTLDKLSLLTGLGSAVTPLPMTDDQAMAIQLMRALLLERLTVLRTAHTISQMQNQPWEVSIYLHSRILREQVILEAYLDQVLAASQDTAHASK